MKHLFLSLLISMTSISALAQSQIEKDNEVILRYISDKGLDAMNIGSGLYYVDEETGTGENPDPSSTVRVAYRGYFTNGEVFDESGLNGATFSLTQVIQGWTIGIPFLKEGGRGKLLIPSGLAYGDRARNGIPANGVLFFAIHLIEVL
jgi:FKBP-type peptidyl-prolyl cis-trans isomerase FkpA